MFLAPEAGFAQGFDTFDNRLLTVAKLGAMHSLPLPRFLLSQIPVEALAD